jgi:hypothetical protein
MDQFIDRFKLHSFVIQHPYIFLSHLCIFMACPLHYYHKWVWSDNNGCGLVIMGMASAKHFSRSAPKWIDESCRWLSSLWTHTIIGTHSIIIFIAKTHWHNFQSVATKGAQLSSQLRGEARCAARLAPCCTVCTLVVWYPTIIGTHQPHLHIIQLQLSALLIPRVR